MNYDKAIDKFIVAFGFFAICMLMVFWVTVAYVAFHFISKFW